MEPLVSISRYTCSRFQRGATLPAGIEGEGYRSNEPKKPKWSKLNMLRLPDGQYEIERLRSGVVYDSVDDGELSPAGSDLVS